MVTVSWDETASSYSGVLFCSFSHFSFTGENKQRLAPARRSVTRGKENPIVVVSEFEAQLQILELLDNAIFTAGYKAVLHIHSVVEECEIVDLIEEIDVKKKNDPKKRKRKPLFVKNGAVVKCRVQVNNLICIENFSDFARLGRFTL